MLINTTPYRPGRPKDVAKRDEIVLAATQLFMDNGYELTSMEAVAKKAGVSKLTIYSHFADKSELFRAIIGYRCHKMGLPENFATLVDTPPKEALLQIGTTVANIIFREDSVRLQRVIQGEAAHHPEVVRSFYETGPKRIRIAFCELLSEYNKRGKLSIPDPIVATEQFFSLLKGEKLFRAMLLMDPIPASTDLTRHIQNTVSFFLAAYSPTECKKETEQL